MAMGHGGPKEDTSAAFLNSLDGVGATQPVVTDSEEVMQLLGTTETAASHSPTTSEDEEEKEEAPRPPPAVSFSIRDDPGRTALHTSRIYRYKTGGRIGGRDSGHWKEGWMVLYGDGNLVWYNDRHCSLAIGSTNVKEYPRRLKFGPLATDYADVSGPVPSLPVKDASPRGLLALPAWTATKPTLWLFVKEEEEMRDWLAALATVVGKKDVFQRLASQQHPAPVSRTHLSDDTGRLQRLGLLSHNGTLATNNGDDDSGWDVIWQSVLNHRQLPDPSFGSGDSSAFSATVRRRKRRSRAPHKPRPATPTTDPHAAEDADAEEEKEEKEDTQDPLYATIPVASEYVDVKTLPAKTSKGEEEEPAQVDSGLSVSSPAEEEDDMDTLVIRAVQQQEQRRQAREHFFQPLRPASVSSNDDDDGDKDRSKTLTQESISHDLQETQAQRPETVPSSAPASLTVENLGRHSWQGPTEAAAVAAAVIRHTESETESSRYSSLESLVIDGVRVSKAQLIRRRLQESREDAIRAKLPYPAYIPPRKLHPGPPLIPTSPVPNDEPKPAAPAPESAFQPIKVEQEVEQEENEGVTSVARSTDLSTDAESEEEDAAFIAKALAVERKRVSALEKDREDADKTPEPEMNGLSLAKGLAQDTREPHPVPRTPTSSPTEEMENVELVQSSETRRVDYREGPLKPLTGEIRRREKAVVVESRAMSTVVMESRQSRLGEVQSRLVAAPQQASIHRSVEALMSAQEDARLSQLNEMIEAAKRELEKNQRLREQLEAEKTGAHSSQPASLADYSASRRAALDDIIHHVDHSANGTPDEIAVPVPLFGSLPFSPPFRWERCFGLVGGATSRLPVPAWERRYPTPFRSLPPQ